uniref:Uncharacterized protein n=1 Tax=Chenopodium quinoa TaxID=63459 RepID=A0A803MSZ2_CHEQI
MKWTRKDVAVAATRVCVYSGFCWAHPNAMVIHLPILVSDHSSIILETDPKKEKRKRGIKLESRSLYFREDSEQAKQKDLTMKEEKMDEERVKLEFWKQQYNRKACLSKCNSCGSLLSCARGIPHAGYWWKGVAG